MATKRHGAPVTLRDVARAVGVDVSTVSRVLQNKGRVADDTRKRILETAERLGYQGNPVARALKTARSSTILMVVPQIENPIFASAIIAAEIEARRAGYALLVAYDQGGMGSEIIEDISRHSMIEGVIIASFDEDDPLRQTLASTNRPHVIINRVLAGDPDCIAMDTRTAARIGVEHLVRLGHRRIGHLAGRLGRFNGEARRQGWADAMAAAGLPPAAELVAEAGYYPDRVPDAVDRLLAAGVTAIHAATLLTGAAAIARLHVRGVRVPDEVSVVTMHDDLLARVAYPAITTVELPTEEMGRAAVRRLVGLVDAARGRRKAEGDPEGTGGGVLLLPPGQLVERDSTAAPPA
ncbi:LacI family DNA-binding transcriptional regulator [Paralimibaculum aggregatum]|uniref:LacI family DNA-binding transcriptional regulator n=1 Tax=Paralimibaculum aggregatum TaxID=3036245 RepID=A0ABQ6LPB0_9RHOB|nr:LacI family DNA-binding transcriptional regulator [Limibaculum sp. NKW23]GMG82135.1 LacI family DNA-binding transcriptional regulator [Limibaculum sp. NKW23]